MKFLYQPRHDKTNEVSVRPAKTQISLGIHPVWSESSLSAWRKLRSLATHQAHSEDSDQTGRMPRLIWVFTGRTVTLLVLSWGGSYLKWICSELILQLLYTLSSPWIWSPIALISLYLLLSLSSLSVKLSSVSFFSSLRVNSGDLLQVDMSFWISSTLFLVFWTRVSWSITWSRICWMYSQTPANT